MQSNTIHEPSLLPISKSFQSESERQDYPVKTTVDQQMLAIILIWRVDKNR
jgi:hypothetical protein